MDRTRSAKIFTQQKLERKEALSRVILLYKIQSPPLTRLHAQTPAYQGLGLLKNLLGQGQRGPQTSENCKQAGLLKSDSSQATDCATPLLPNTKP